MAVTVTIRLLAKDPYITLGVLTQALPITRTYEGNHYSHTHVNQDKPNEIILIQGWESKEHQQNYISWRQETGDLQQLVNTLVEAPAVTFWNSNPA
jgi:quinol monooxygenase YgiN